MSVTRSLGRASALVLGAGAVALGVSATAVAAPPNCTAADMTAVMAGVSTNMSAYLFTHPEVNDFFSSLHGTDKTAVRQKTQDYLNQNPQVRDEIGAIRAPAVDLRNRCGIPPTAEISGVL